MNDDERVDKLILAKTMILREMSFFSPFVARMKGTNFREADTEELKKAIPTMSVDSRGRLWYNKEFCEAQSVDDLKFIIKHEILHTALLHVGRTGGRNNELFNVAIDLVVNDTLAHEIRLTPPKDGLHTNSEHVWAKNGVKIEKVNEKSSERIYGELRDQISKRKNKSRGKGKSNGAGDGEGEGNDAPNRGASADSHIHNPEAVGDEPVTDKEQREIERNNREMVAMAATQAKMRGNLPAGLQRLVDEILDPRIDFREYVMQQMRSAIISGFTYKRPSRRSHSVGVFLPKPVKEGAEAIVAFDLSGSIGKEEMEYMLGGCVAMVNQFPVLKLTILTHDEKVQSVVELDRATETDILEAELRGGGGTSHKDVFRWVKENKPDADLLVLMTDGYSDIEEIEEPDGLRVLWVLTKDGCNDDKIPWGDTIRIS